MTRVFVQYPPPLSMQGCDTECQADGGFPAPCEMYPNELHAGCPRQHVVDCRSEEGETVALIDTAITALRLVSRRDLSAAPVRAAIAGMLADYEIRTILEPRP